MKQLLILSVSGLACGLSLAQDVGRVMSSTPLIQQVAVPRQVCHTEQVAVQQPKSGAGADMGAIAGGAIGNAVGSGSGQAAATMIGIMGGAVLGDKIEGGSATQVQNVQRCTTQTFYENRTVSYNVVYEFAGKQYTVQLPYEPGATIPLQVTPAGMGAAPTTPSTPTVYVQPPAVVVTQPVAPSYYVQPYYPPVSLHLGWGYWWGGPHGPRHWR